VLIKQHITKGASLEGYLQDDPEAVARDFVELVRGGFEQGFGEAREILDGLGVFGGQLEADAMKTRELVLQGYDRFLLDRLPDADQQQ